MQTMTIVKNGKEERRPVHHIVSTDVFGETIELPCYYPLLKSNEEAHFLAGGGCIIVAVNDKESQK